MDLVSVLVEITFGHQVMKWLVWGKLCMRIRVDLPETEKFLQGDVKWQDWKLEEQYGQGERGQGAPWPCGVCGTQHKGESLPGTLQAGQL